MCFFLFLAITASCSNSQDTKPRLVVQLARVVTAHVLSGVKSELKAIEYLINELLKLNSVLSWLHWSLASFHVSPWSFCWIKMHVLLVSPPTRLLLSGEVAGSLSLSLTQWVTRSSPWGWRRGVSLCSFINSLARSLKRNQSCVAAGSARFVEIPRGIT